MPDPEIARWDTPGLTWDMPGLRYDSPPPAPATAFPPPNSTSIPLNSTTSMEYWEITKDRAEKTLPVWQQYIATVKINGKLPADLDTLIGGFMPLVTARVTAQDNQDTAFRAVQSALLVMKTLGLRVAGMIESQLDEDVKLMDKLEKLRRVAPGENGRLEGQCTAADCEGRWNGTPHVPHMQLPRISDKGR